MSALFDPRHENRRALGRQLARAYPVDPDTPRDMLRLLDRLQ